MKTITSLTISVLLIVLSITMLGFALNNITQANDIVTSLETGQIVDQTMPYLVYGLVQVCIALFLMLNGIKVFHLFLKFYKEYQETKRDTEIKESIKEAKYDKLYKDLNATNIPEQRESIIRAFYKDKDRKPHIGDLLQLMSNGRISV